ncbi:MAG TPA: 3-hydroxyacyl-CoA dehydrogenase NAD-binding domain-containing protein [Bacteroidota bacterium]|nr:3-hydroxyacyl-CoA dehydrogenase NAD-binding domain-containing protein [Bacteroidota bacterium]
MSHIVKHLGIVGAGTMGTAIAKLAILNGVEVLLYDINETILRRGIERMKAEFRHSVQQEKMKPEESIAALDLLKTRTALSDIGHCDLILETVVEDLRVKQDLLKHLDANARPTTILATGTVTFSIASVATYVKIPERIIGLHFFQPVETTQLVEIIRGNRTQAGVVEIASSFAAALQKKPLLVQDTPGFLVTRTAFPFYSEALRLLGEHVADAEQIDRITKTIGGFSTGPFESLDRRGLDSFLTVAKSLYEQTYHEPRFRPQPLLKSMVDAGLLGKKSGKGFYTYEEEL